MDEEDTPNTTVYRYAPNPNGTGVLLVGTVSPQAPRHRYSPAWRAGFFKAGGGVAFSAHYTWAEAVEAMDRGIAVWRLTGG